MVKVESVRKNKKKLLNNKEDINPAQLQTQLQDPPLTLVNQNNNQLLGITIPKEQISNLQFVK